MTRKTQDRRLMNEKVHTELKKRIINCEMMPGDPISEDQLSAEFGYSRTPIREALLQLKRERLVDIWARKGIFVKEIVLKDVYQIYQMRLIIEPSVARIVAPVIDEQRLREFRKGFETIDPVNDPFLDNFSLDRQLHDFIIESTRNDYLIATYTDLLDLNQRVRILTGRNRARVIEGVGEHIAIIDAFLSKDEDAIVETITRHIQNSQNAALRLDGFVRG